MKFLSALGWIFAITYGTWWYFSDPAPTTLGQVVPEETLQERQLSLARVVCDTVLKKSLNDPSSAETGPLSDGFYGSWPAINTTENIVTVLPRFRAKNGFGGLVMSNFKCVVRFNGEDVVGIEELSEL